MRNKLAFVIVVLFVCLLVASSGCILFPDSHSKRYVCLITLEYDPAYDDIANINYTQAKQDLENNGYNVTTYLDPDYRPEIDDYGLRCRKYIDDFPELQILISAWVYNSTKYGDFHVSYRPTSSEHQNPENVEDAKQYVKSKAIEVAGICNLTIDWNKAVFSVDYSD
ncbi:MAG: hypothetical protein QMC80_05580 [Thermoplasmatales archaeon]|nr:hypothetical protein [Thermoplasmatales archaeon]